LGYILGDFWWHFSDFVTKHLVALFRIWTPASMLRTLRVFSGTKFSQSQDETFLSLINLIFATLA
jgi:hypothetical protein